MFDQSATWICGTHATHRTWDRWQL